MELFEGFYSLTWEFRVLIIILVALLIHFLIKTIRRISEWLVDPAYTGGAISKELFAKHHPKFATVASLLVSALTFSLYFLAFGLILKEFSVSLTAYLATASIAGLAVAFGAQGLVQDIVIGLTIIFSDIFDIGDVIEASGQVGRVEKIGLRFTKIINLTGQNIYIPNRNIALVGRYPSGSMKAYADIQIPDGLESGKVATITEQIASGMREQYRAIILAEPEILEVRHAGPGGWDYLRVIFTLWPGQNAIIETTFRQRIVAEMKQLNESYADWMVTVVYRVS
jgi:moderate conductance mechanosensitive channel